MYVSTKLYTMILCAVEMLLIKIESHKVPIVIVIHIRDASILLAKLLK